MQSFRHIIEVRWSDCDVNQHVRHSAYSDFCTHARIEMLRAGGFGFRRFQEQGFGPVIFKEWTEFLKEVRMSERVAVVVSMAGLSVDGSRFRIHHELFRDDGVMAARHQVTGAWLDLASRKLKVPPADLADIFARLDRTPDYETIEVKSNH